MPRTPFAWPDRFPETLPAALERAAERFPERGVTLFDGRGRPAGRRSYPELLAGARVGAGRWNALGLGAGEPVLVALPTSWSWLDAWLGAALAGGLPVAVAPGAALGAAEAHVRKVDGLLGRLGARRVVVPEAVREGAEGMGARRAAEAAVTAEELEGVTPEDRSVPEPDPGETAFLQLTSGSTGVPRAVQIPHRAALYNNAASREAIDAPYGSSAGTGGAGEIEAVVSWLPLHHDMGLVGCLLLSITFGYELRLFQPTAFLARPRPWLEEFSRVGTALSPGPNFGYQLCVERLDEADREGLDLSGWRDAMTGAEMIRPETVEAFNDAFAGAGFRPETFRPCYGLAEATLAVTFDRRGEGMRTRPLPPGAESVLAGSEVVSVGEPMVGTDVRITGPAGEPVADGAVGEVEIRGPGVFTGYYNDPEATAETLVEGWMKTGDLGFLHDRELYVTGRSKDLLILRGNNVMPHELEWLAEEAVGGGGTMRSGAFSVARGPRGEEPVLVVETAERDPERLAALGHDIRSRVGRALSLPLADVVFVRRGKIPKTTSGKVRRRTLRRMYLDRELETLETGGSTA